MMRLLVILAICTAGGTITFALHDLNVTLREVCVASPSASHVAFRDFVPPHP